MKILHLQTIHDVLRNVRCTFAKFSTPTQPHTTIHYYIFTLVRLKACRRDMGLVQKKRRNVTEMRHTINGIMPIQSALLTVYCLSLDERNEILIIGNDDRIK